MPLMKPDAKDIYGKIFGANKKRKQLQEALDYMREGDTLVVWKLSRLTRSLTQVISTVKDLEEWQIGLKVITQNIDTSTPEGGLFFYMNAAFDQFQRKIIVENTQAGLKSARKNGWIGSLPTLMTDERIRAAQSMLKNPIGSFVPLWDLTQDCGGQDTGRWQTPAYQGIQRAAEPLSV